MYICQTLHGTGIFTDQARSGFERSMGRHMTVPWVVGLGLQWSPFFDSDHSQHRSPGSWSPGSFVVSVFPVPAGPAGAPPKYMPRASRCAVAKAGGPKRGGVELVLSSGVE